MKKISDDVTQGINKSAARLEFDNLPPELIIGPIK